MKPVEIYFSSEVRRKLREGIALPVRAIQASFGPRGSGTLFHRPPAPPEVLFDGFSIAREALASTPVKSQGSELLKETLFNLDRDLGDGTSSLALVAEALVRAFEPVVHAGHDPEMLAHALLRGGEIAVAEIEKITKPYHDGDFGLGTARSSAKGEYALAETVVDLHRRLGDGGQIVVREAMGRETHVTVLPGMSLPSGHVSEHLKGKSAGFSDVYYNPFVLLADERIEDFGKLVPILEGFARSDKSLIIVARGVLGTALSTLVVNVRNNGLKATAIAVPDISSRAIDVLSDLSLLTGGQIVSEHTGITLEGLRPDMLGQLDKVEVSNKVTFFQGAAKNPEALAMRRAELLAEAEQKKYLSLDRERAELRLARLSGGIGEIHVGACTTPDQKRKILLFKKVAAALSSARRSGVVPGGGGAYRIAADRLAGMCPGQGTESTAFRLLSLALCEPEFRLIRSFDSSRTVLGSLASRQDCASFDVLDALTGRVGNAFEQGLLDPSELTAEVIRRAVSFAAAILRCEVSISKS